MHELPSERTGFQFGTVDRIDPRLVTAHARVLLVIEMFRHVGAT